MITQFSANRKRPATAKGTGLFVDEQRSGIASFPELYEAAHPPVVQGSLAAPVT